MRTHRGRQDRLRHAGLRADPRSAGCPHEIPAEEGVVVAVEVLTNKSTYNTLELASGRMAKVGKGDVVVGALGHRKALFGYSGHVPAALQPGDIVQMLNIGGVLGICDSVNPDKGPPFDCRVIGGVLNFPYLGERIGVPARVGLKRLDGEATLDSRGVPVVALAGTCMEAGKTAAACAVDRAHAASRPGGRRFQGHRRVTAAGHPGDGRCRRAPVHDLYRSRSRLDHAEATGRR